MKELVIHNPHHLPTLPYTQFMDFQGDLKDPITPDALDKMKRSLKRHGVFVPKFLWFDNGHAFILDGHQTKTALASLEADGWTIPPIPYIAIDAAGRADAADKLLQLNSRYAKINVNATWLDSLALDTTELSEMLDGIEIPELTGIMPEFDDTEMDTPPPVVLTPSQAVTDQLAALQKTFGTATLEETLQKAVDYAQEKAEEQAAQPLPRVAVDVIDAPPQVDRATECQAEWQTAIGQVWQVGAHRLAVGDCTQADTLERLMQGEQANLMLTDPPYGIKRDKGFGGFGGFGTPIARRQYADDWDSDRPDKATFDTLLSFADASIIFGGNFFADMLPQGKHWIVWDKKNTMPTFGDCELAWTNMKRNSVKLYTVVYNGLIGKESERFHPTQKPVKLFCELLLNYTEEAQVIFDPFLGSGTTMVAAEQTGRRCFGSEIAPAYCAVTLTRMKQAFPALDIRQLS